jgi:hypothetical protein
VNRFRPEREDEVHKWLKRERTTLEREVDDLAVPEEVGDVALGILSGLIGLYESYADYKVYLDDPDPTEMVERAVNKRNEIAQVIPLFKTSKLLSHPSEMQREVGEDTE